MRQSAFFSSICGQLSVFDVNVSARKCYEKAGFTVIENMPDAFSHQDEMWGRCIMVHEEI